MAAFRSNEEFFQAVNDLIATLEAGGHQEAAAELREGFGCLNGLTDGAALFLESIEKVQASTSPISRASSRSSVGRCHRSWTVCHRVNRRCSNRSCIKLPPRYKTRRALTGCLFRRPLSITRLLILAAEFFQKTSHRQHADTG